MFDVVVDGEFIIKKKHGINEGINFFEDVVLLCWLYQRHPPAMPGVKK